MPVTPLLYIAQQFLRWAHRWCTAVPSAVWLSITPKRLGAKGERVAARFLERGGYRILYRNFRTAHGEVDLIAVRGAILCLIEVKTRRHAPNHRTAVALDPLERIDRKKLELVERAGRVFCHDHWRVLKRGRIRQVRIETVGVIFWPGFFFPWSKQKPKVEHRIVEYCSVPE